MFASVNSYEATPVSHRHPGAGIRRPFGAGIILKPVYIKSTHFAHGCYCTKQKILELELELIQTQMAQKSRVVG